MDSITKESYLKDQQGPSKYKIDAELLQQRLQFYEYENEKLEKSLKLLHILDDDGTIHNSETAKIVGKLVEIQEKFGVERFDPTAMSMVHIEHMYNKKDVSGKLQKCLNVQNHISNKINAESKEAQQALVKVKQQINELKVSQGDLETLQDQLKRYEGEVKRYENHYPWLNDPTLDLLNIKDKIHDLKVVQTEELKLSASLDQYKGLKPNIAEAYQQLNKLKEEYDNINSKIFDIL